MLAKNFGWKQIFISKGNKNKTVSAQIEEMREDNLPEIGERVVLVGGIYKGKTVKIIRYTAVMVRVEFVEKAGIPARSTTIMKSSLPRKKKSPQPTTVQVPTKTSRRNYLRTTLVASEAIQLKTMYSRRPLV